MPAPPLSEFVQLFWFYENYVPGHSCKKERLLPDGSVGRVEVLKSLDGVFGLDQEAIKAVKQWRFVPGTRLGQPVAVLVGIELTFTLR
mgnify:CR=1 FL=1